MILSPLSKVVLEAWEKCVLGYTLLPNCCAENGLHPCTIFQVGKPNSLGSCDHPQASLANRLLCAQKYNLLSFVHQVIVYVFPGCKPGSYVNG